MDAVFSTVETADRTIAQNKRISHDLDQVTREREVVQEEILRTGLIPSGKVVSGFVYFPKHGETDHLMFCFPLEGQLFQFVYSQQQACL